MAQRGRLTLLFCDADLHGRLHHFLVGFEYFRDKSTAFDERQPLTQYYEQMKHSLLENDNYVEALIDANDALFTVDLTHGQLEQIFYRTTALRQFDLQMTLPCSYDDYCAQRRHFVTPETLENYRIVDTASKLLERFHSGFKYVTVEYREQTPCGEPVWLQKTVLMAQDTVFDAASGGEMPVIHGIILFRDTSIFHAQEQAENQRLQEAFEEADSASRAKTAFMNRMSHDIRTPINGIIGLLNIDEAHFDDQALLLANHQKMKVSADHLLSLINDVLQMSKLEDGNTVLTHEVISLVDLTRDIVTIVIDRATERGLIWDYEKGKSNIPYPYIYGSPVHLRQIFLNIYGNCIKYNRPGGRITTIVDTLEEHDNICTYRWTISDTGVGMSPEFAKNSLFQPFSQEHPGARTLYQGTGLGMSIVKELVTRMNGSIQVDSAPGVGTTFTVELPLPLAQPPQQAAPAAAAEPTRSLDGVTVLLTEDNALNMEIAQFFLQDAGASIIQAWNGQQALDIFQSSRPGEIDVILMDVMMPVMNGLEATRRIRALPRPDAKTELIFALSADAFLEDERQSVEAGMNGHFSKPVNYDKLRRCVGTFFKSREDV